ncbi:MAG TPA: cyclic nucleotide-binding domain-containing protein [Verrucomicrobiae bacterium]|nr:cyclic nucleotide-binding domain-containing protein [Verrucomicrobiae bacterium]
MSNPGILEFWLEGSGAAHHQAAAMLFVRDRAKVATARRFEGWWAMDPKLELLERVPLFAGVGPNELDEIGRIVDEVEVPAGTALTHEGRQEGYFFVIVSGTVRIERGGRTINTIGAGDFLGEIALLDGGPRTATATTESPCRLLSLTFKRFHQLLDSSPPVRTAILEAVGVRLRALDAESAI